MQTIQLQTILDKVDNALNRDNYAEAQRILNYWLEEAVALFDYRGELGILSELMGLYRKLGKRDDGLNAVNRGFKIIVDHNLNDLISTATVYINGATALKAFGDPKLALEYYALAEKIYTAKLDKNDAKVGALYNNMGLAYAEIKEIENARECFIHALKIMNTVENGDLDIAITYLNLADLFDVTDVANEKAIAELVEKAYQCFNNDNIERNGYYAFVCTKCASGFGYYGYFIYENELKKRAKEIYERN